MKYIALIAIVMYSLIAHSGALSVLPSVGGGTELMDAVYDGDIAKVRRLISSGKDVNEVKDINATALMTAAYKDRYEIAKLLINNGANVSVISDEGFTAISIAAFKSTPSMINLLLDHGADPYISKESYPFKAGPALYEAVQSGKIDNARVLLERGVEISFGPDSEIEIARSKNVRSAYSFPGHR